MRDPLALLRIVGDFLREKPNAISKDDVETVMAAGVTAREAYAMLLAEHCGVDVYESPQGRQALRTWFIPMVQEIDPRVRNPYTDFIHLPDAQTGAFRLGYLHYQPYECFVRDDIFQTADGMLMPQVGYYACEYRYPALLEGDTLWMSVTPNEVNTLVAPIAHATGNVLTYGLGMGYYPFMVTQKPDVRSLTVVERSPEVIELFVRFILPQFPCRDKVRIVQADGYDYAQRQAPLEHFDTALVDLWHDAGDGLPIYKDFQSFARLCPQTRFDYWIEDSIKLYDAAFQK